MEDQWVSAIFTAIGALSIFGIGWQVKVNHDKARREKALDVKSEWDSTVNKNSFRYAKLMFSLPPQDVKKVRSGYEIEVNKSFLMGCFPELAVNSEAEQIKLKPEFVVEMRHSMVTLLNSFENIALAYKHSVGDKKILDDAFYNLLIKGGMLRKFTEFMENFDNSWPALEDLPKLMNPPKSRKPAA